MPKKIRHWIRHVWKKYPVSMDPASRVPTALYSTCVLLTFFVFFKPFQTSSVTVNKAVIGLETSHFCLTHSPHRNDAMVSEKHVTQSIGQQMLLLFTDQNITIKKPFLSCSFCSNHFCKYCIVKINAK